jgi:5-methylcytosine-specific restriction endonuclease McrA
LWVELELLKRDFMLVRRQGKVTTRIDTPCCAYCGLPVARDASLDHRTPTDRGGQLQLANLAVCCGRCDRSRLAEVRFVQK